MPKSLVEEDIFTPADLEDTTPNFYITSRRRDPGFKMSYEHTHRITEIYYLHKGFCRYSVNTSSFDLSSGDILVIAAGDRHSSDYSSKDPTTRFAFFLDKEKIPHSLSGLIPNADDILSRTGLYHLDVSGQEIAYSVFTRILTDRTSADPFKETRLWFYTSELLLTLAGHGDVANNLSIPEGNVENDVQYALHYIEENYSSPLSLQSVSQQLNLNASYFSHKFRMVTGFTFVNYLNTYRLKKACDMLLISDDSITQIAFECGFSSGNYFKDLFRAKYGIPPREYRKKYGLSKKADRIRVQT